MPSHLDAGIQKLIKVMAELPRGHSQLTASAPGGLHHISSRVVQLGRRVIQIRLRLLERFGARRKLEGQKKCI